MIIIEKLNCLQGIQLVQIGAIEELRQQDYHGKRVYVRISDETSDSIESKIDFGVHKHLSLDQDEYCFDIACFDEGANLLINSKEQMFTESGGCICRNITTGCTVTGTVGQENGAYMLCAPLRQRSVSWPRKSTACRFPKGCGSRATVCASSAG